LTRSSKSAKVGDGMNTINSHIRPSGPHRETLSRSETVFIPPVGVRTFCEVL
jgi:hypothetical protein